MKQLERAKYVEPKNYIPKEIQKKYGVGEFAKKEEPNKETDEQKKRENEELRKVFKGK